MAGLVEILVINALHFAIRPGWNHGRFPRLLQGLEHPLLRIVALIGDHNRGIESGQQGIGSFQVAGLSGGQQESRRITQGINGGMNFRAQPALAAADGLVRTLFF
jgi:hypothetical protein